MLLIVDYLMCCIIYKIYGVVAVHPYRHLIEVLLSARIQSKRVIVRVTWACSSTARSMRAEIA